VRSGWLVGLDQTKALLKIAAKIPILQVTSETTGRLQAVKELYLIK
jgi:hypothetical protein